MSLIRQIPRVSWLPLATRLKFVKPCGAISVRHLCEKKVPEKQPTTAKDERVPRPAEFMRQKQGSEDPHKKKNIIMVTWRSLAVTSVVVGGIVAWISYLKKEKQTQMDKERKKEIGKAKIGGPFSLIDQDGNPKSNQDFVGKWILLYFGFTHCPDICPDEMEKISTAYTQLAEERKKKKSVDEIVPLFITVDPVRDTPKVVKEYIKEFHPDWIGLTGSEEKVKEASKSYRVYFSAGPRDDDDDYIVDHTIITYLVDPDGHFVDYYGQRKTATDLVTSIKVHMKKHKDMNKTSLFS